MRPHRWQPTRLPHPWDYLGKKTGAGCHFLLQCMKVKRESEVAQSYPTLRDPMDCSLPGSSIHGIFQARVLEWSAIPLISLIFLKGSLVFPILLFSFISLYWSLRKDFLISPCYSLGFCIQMGIYFLFSFAFCFSSFHSYLWGLLRQPFCLFAVLFLGDGLDHCLLYNVMNLCPYFFRHPVYQI